MSSSSIPSRDVLSRIFRDHASLRAFETLFNQVNTELPGAVDGVANSLQEVSTEVIALNLLLSAVNSRLDELDYANRVIKALQAELDNRVGALEAYTGVAWH